MDQAYLITPELAAEIRRIIRKVDGVRGDGVVNEHGSITLRVARERGAATPDNRGVRMRVTAIANDYITCRVYDGTSNADEDVLVAKPPEARHGLAIGQAYYSASITGWTTVDAQTAEVTDGTDTEDIVTFPRYAVGAEVYADFQPRGGTGVVDGSLNPIQWLERPGRVWAKQC